MILNKPTTGEPVAFIHSGLLNGLRTAAVSGVMLSHYVKARQPAAFAHPLNRVGTHWSIAS